MPTHNSCWRILTEKERAPRRTWACVCVLVLVRECDMNFNRTLFSLNAHWKHAFPIHWVSTSYLYLYFPVMKIFSSSFFFQSIFAFDHFTADMYGWALRNYIHPMEREKKREKKCKTKQLLQTNVCVSLTWKYSCVHFLLSTNRF